MVNLENQIRENLLVHSLNAQIYVGEERRERKKQANLYKWAKSQNEENFRGYRFRTILGGATIFTLLPALYSYPNGLDERPGRI